MSVPNGVVNGTISGGGTTATVHANVSCVNSVPTGTLSGTIDFFGGSGTRHFSFASNTASIVATIKSINSVGAKFTNVSLQENTFTPITGCTAYLNATRLNSTQWVGSLVIVCPSGKQLFVFGIFSGSTVVNQQVFCQPLL